MPVRSLKGMESLMLLLLPLLRPPAERRHPALDETVDWLPEVRKLPLLNDPEECPHRSEADQPCEVEGRPPPKEAPHGEQNPRVCLLLGVGVGGGGGGGGGGAEVLKVLVWVEAYSSSSRPPACRSAQNHQWCTVSRHS